MSTRLGDTGPNPVSTPSPVNWSVSRPAVNPARLFRVRMAQNRLSEAEELLSQLGEGSTFTEEDNNSTENELLRLAALLSWARGDVAQAENQLRAAFSQGGFSFNIEGFPADFADLLRSLEKHQPAQDEYQRILTLNPNYPPGCLWAGDLVRIDGSSGRGGALLHPLSRALAGRRPRSA